MLASSPDGATKMCRLPPLLGRVCFALLVVSCTGPGDPPLGVAHQRIVLGSPSDAAIASTSVAVVVGSKGLCSGVLVAPAIVLTAASCLDPVKLGVVDQRAVTHDTRVLIDAKDVQTAASGQFVDAQSTIVHPQYDRATLAHDVGVVLLSTPAAARLFPVIYTDTTGGLRNAEVRLWGFGVSRLIGGDPDPNSSGTQKQIVKPVGDCTELAGRSNTEYLCFEQTSGGGICEGDIGGPTIITDGPDDILVGLHAFYDAKCSALGIDARVSAELDFIGGQVCVRDGACVPSCGTVPLAEDPDCTATDAAPAMDAAMSDGAPHLDAPQADVEPAAGDAAQTDGASSPGANDASEGCGCHLSAPRGHTARAVGWTMAMALLVWHARRRRRMA
ncbi:MAG TPA: trypsin-like serine protease [Polyangiaceae bacterium]